MASTRGFSDSTKYKSTRSSKRKEIANAATLYDFSISSQPVFHTRDVSSRFEADGVCFNHRDNWLYDIFTGLYTNRLTGEITDQPSTIYDTNGIPIRDAELDEGPEYTLTFAQFNQGMRLLIESETGKIAICSWCSKRQLLTTALDEDRVRHIVCADAKCAYNIFQPWKGKTKDG